MQGGIQCASLVLGGSSQLEGCAVAEEVVVGGRLIGSIRAVRVTLQAGSRVEGDLLCQGFRARVSLSRGGKAKAYLSPAQYPAPAAETFISGNLRTHQVLPTDQ